MFRWTRPTRRYRTRVWMGIASLSDGDPHPDSAVATLTAALAAIEQTGSTVRSVTAAPVSLPGGTAVLLVVTYREPTGPTRGGG